MKLKLGMLDNLLCKIVCKKDSVELQSQDSSSKKVLICRGLHDSSMEERICLACASTF